VKKVIMTLGYIFLAIIVVVIALVGSIAIIGNQLDKESKAYVDVAIPAIVSTWDIGEIEKRASPEYNNEVDYDELEQDFESLQQLGELVEYKGSTGDANISFFHKFSYEITADYTASAEFEEGTTTIRMSLIKHGDRWQILEFTINPDEFTGRKDII
jgi:hypothetical protein